MFHAVPSNINFRVRFKVRDTFRVWIRVQDRVKVRAGLVFGVRVRVFLSALCNRTVMR